MHTHKRQNREGYGAKTPSMLWYQEPSLLNIMSLDIHYYTVKMRSAMLLLFSEIWNEFFLILIFCKLVLCNSLTKAWMYKHEQFMLIHSTYVHVLTLKHANCIIIKSYVTIHETIAHKIMVLKLWWAGFQTWAVIVNEFIRYRDQ